MSRRRRNKVKAPAVPASDQRPVPRDHMARVRVADDLWADFRAAAGQTPLNLVLGRLVEREVDRHRARRAPGGSVDDRELLDALDRAHELHENLSNTIAALERRLNRPR